MEPLTNPVARILARLWRVSPPLTAVGLLMLAALALALVGLIADPRLITGVPAWLKPAKFAASTAIYSLTLAWVFTALPAWEKTRRLVGWATAAIFVFEVAIIDVQAWRGTTSHFNISTPLNAVLFAAMGTAILLQTLASVAVAVALWRQRSFEDRSLAWALRLGMTLTIVGAATGGLMTRPTTAQLAEARLTDRMPIAGAHTVGGPDGGPGLTGTGWSLEHGDLRVPHFVGLHALQMLAIVLAGLRRRSWSEPARVRAVFVASGALAGLFAILLTQALRGQSFAAPDGATMAALLVWALATAGGWFLVRPRHGFVQSAI
jgi:hypothetical protein